MRAQLQSYVFEEGEPPVTQTQRSELLSLRFLYPQISHWNDTALYNAWGDFTEDIHLCGSAAPFQDRAFLGYILLRQEGTPFNALRFKGPEPCLHRLRQIMHQTSFVSAPHALALALDALARETNQPLHVHAPSNYARLHGILSSTSTAGEFLAGKASIGSAAPVNEFLRARGFSLTFPEPPPAGMVCAGIVDILVRWWEDAQTGTLQWEGTESVPSIRIKQFSQFSNDVHPHPIFKLHTKDDFSVYITRAVDGVNPDFLALHQDLSGLTLKLQSFAYLSHEEQTSRQQEEYGAVNMPMLNLHLKGELPLFNSLHISLGATDYYGSDGKFEAILKLNEKGAVAKVAAGGGFLRACVTMPKPDYSFDSPFWFWIAKEGVVYFAAYITRDALGNPGIL